MQANMTLPNSEEEQDPTVELWLLYFLAQHYYFLNDFPKALEYINKGIEHTPTLIELYSLKGYIYAAAGD